MHNYKLQPCIDLMTQSKIKLYVLFLPFWSILFFSGSLSSSILLWDFCGSCLVSNNSFVTQPLKKYLLPWFLNNVTSLNSGCNSLQSLSFLLFFRVVAVVVMFCLSPFWSPILSGLVFVVVSLESSQFESIILLP